MVPRLVASSLALAAVIAVAGPVRAEDDETTPQPTSEQLQAWLATKPASADISTPTAPEAPPPPPRRHGFVVETTVGAMGQVGAMQHVSPTLPWFRAAFGWEPAKWVMLLAQGDIAFGNTSYASPPPDPRGFALYGFSAAARFGFSPADRIGLFAQGEFGIARVSNDVLATYGFTDANSIGPYFGGLVGFEWYQVSPHVALVVHAGVRSYGNILDRAIGSDSAIAWLGSGGLKYTF
jgi:hypothetical protein